MTRAPFIAALCAAAALSLAPASAQAFCGFYVSGAEASLYNNATQVILMREGTRTVLSIQNNYKGPAEDFAMVVPVPIVLQQANVNTLDASLFAKVDTMTAPRLVEYWEQDPCNPWPYPESDAGGSPTSQSTPTSETPSQVVVEAEFVVAEYNVVVLSASDATALDTWLVNHGYNIPSGAAPYLDPYVQAGMYFFVAEVDVSKVTYEDGRAVLSPLRFWYDSEAFSLPIRLGLINSADQQDLLVYTLGRNQRYEVANYANVTIPTNINVVDDVREEFGAFYEALYARTLQAYPGAVVTEYSWSAGSCDPCPGPTLDEADYLSLGADVLPQQPTYGWDITRLHARYSAGSLGEDLVFREAAPIVGGREIYTADGELETGASPSTTNTFQGRYAIRHPWEGQVECEQPVYGMWGGPPSGGSSEVSSATSPNTQGVDPQDVAGDKPLESYLAQDVPELDASADTDDEGCGCDQTRGLEGRWALLLAGLGLVALRRRR